MSPSGKADAGLGTQAGFCGVHGPAVVDFQPRGDIMERGFGAQVQEALWVHPAVLNSTHG